MKWHTTKKKMFPFAVAGALLALQSHAAEPPEKKREKVLLQRLARSDAQAAALQQRIEELERRVNQLTTASAAPTLLSSLVEPVKASTQSKAEQTSTSKTAQAQVSQAGNVQEQPRPAANRSAPGSFEIDEEAAQRALERTLTQTGALLLPAGTVEVSPGFTYQRTEQSMPALSNVVTAGSSTPTLVLVNQRNRRNEITAHVGVRVGLPYSAQVELDLPFNHVRASQVSDLGAATSDNGSGTGDVTLGLAKTIAREEGWAPDLIGRLSYNFGNGRRRDGSVDLPGGFRQIQGELIALKRQDPLAFVGSIFYNKSFAENGIEPGNVAGFSLSSVLAASPATSLSLGFTQIYRQKQEQNGLKLPGSEQTYGMFNFGATSVLSRDVSLIAQFGIGAGADAPKYNFTIAVPILFR